jgi:SAM-dependent methyltransferase
MPLPKGGPGQHYDVPADDYFKAHDSSAKLAAGKDLLRTAIEFTGKTSGDLLDIGPGRGEILKAAQESGWIAVGVEPSAPFAQRAALFSGAKVLNTAIEDFNSQESSFDVVLLSAVLEHLYDPDAMVAKISRWLRPGGVLFLDVPNERGLYFRIGNFYQKIRGRAFEPFHTFGFSPHALRKLLRKHGLTPQRWRMYAGESMVPKIGLIGALESIAAASITALSRLLGMQTYIETWAVKRKR